MYYRRPGCRSTASFSAAQVWFMQLQDGVEGPSMQLACSQEYPSAITAVATSGLHGAAICAGMHQ